MALKNKDLPQFSISTQKPILKRTVIVLFVLWIVLALAFAWSIYQRGSSNVYVLQQQLAQSQARERDVGDALDDLKQEVANYKRSEFISRSANTEIQAGLAEKDEQISGLKADLDFYQRLVGATGQRHGLTVHDVEFEAMDAGAWQYTVTLTQNINRAGITTGQMRFTVDGVQAGKLKTLNWTELIQKPNDPGQKFGFRYFQQLNGNIMLPTGFTPQHVHVSLSGSSGAVEASFNWAIKKARTV